MKAVLGLKLDPWHDTGAAIVLDDGSRLRVVAISQERLDRVKHSRAFPAQAIAYCLETAGCRLSDLSLVVADFILAPTTEDYFKGSGQPEPVAKSEFYRQLRELGIPVLFAEHHLCHAASAYFGTQWDEAAALVIDGHGSYYETQTLFRCQGNGITKVATSHRPGIGWMYGVVTEALLGFGHLQEGKTMGLAGWTKDGGIWGEYCQGKGNSSNPCEIVYEEFLEEGRLWKHKAPANLPRRRPADDPVSAPFVKYAFAAQAELESGVMQLARAAAKLVPSKRLCYSGGVALNIPANRLILDSGLYEEFFIQPAASDSGIPLGAALLGYYSVLGGSRRWEMAHAFLGREYPSSELGSSVTKWQGPRAESSTATLASLLANNYLVAWCQGASEFGPRALGHRSILCLPRHPQMKAYLNREVKHREMFRPFAPIVPFEHQADYFDLRAPSPFMLLNASVHPNKAASIPAVVHADGTARVQSIHQHEQPELHALLNAVGNLTGVPVLLNTSLNLAGEPIVETPADAVDLFARSKLDALALGPHLLSKVPLQQMLERPNAGVREMVSSRVELDSNPASTAAAASLVPDKVVVLAPNPNHPLYQSWIPHCQQPVLVVERYDSDWEPPADTALLVTHDTYTEPGRSLIRKAVDRGVPTLILADGILEYRNTWEHPQLAPGAMLQPVLGHKIACLGRSQARILESWGNQGKCEVVGSPRFDRYAGLKGRKRKPGEALRVLVTTALTPYFTETHHRAVLESLRDLKQFFAGLACNNGSSVAPVWRLTKGLEREIDVNSNTQDLGGAELAEVLKDVDAVVTTPSSVMLEAMLLGLPVALLDYTNSPHYAPASWRITAQRHVADVMAELANPPEPKMLYQDTILHDALECTTPATPRLLQLIEHMIAIGREQLFARPGLVLPQRILPVCDIEFASAEDRFRLEILFPTQRNAAPSRTLSSVPAVNFASAPQTQSNPKILFISHDASRSGAPMFLLNFMRWLREHSKWDFRIVLRAGGPLEPEFRQWGETHVLKEIQPGSPLLRDVALVYSNTCTNGLFLKNLAGGDIPVLTHVHELGYVLEGCGAENLAAVKDQTGHYVACAEAVAGELNSRQGIPRESISVHHEAIAVSLVRQRALESSRDRRTLGLAPDTRVIAACGLADWRKGPDVFVQLASALQRKAGTSLKLEFVWVGKVPPGEHAMLLSRDLEKLGIAGNVHFIGEQPNPCGWLEACDLFCLPSREDPFPLVMLEAAALGKPVVCFSGSGGAEEFCRRGGGFAVPYLDVEALARQCLALLQDESLRLRTGDAAARLVSESFDIDVVAPRLLGTIENFHQTHSLARTARRQRSGQLWQEAKASIDKGDFKAAQPLLKEARALTPNDLEAVAGLGMIESRLGHWDDALVCWRQAVELKPNNSTFHVNLALALAQQDKPVEAETAARRAVELNPNELEAMRLLARSAERQGRYQEGADWHARVLRLLQSNVDALVGQARCSLKCGHRVLAKILATQALENDPANAEAKSLIEESSRPAPAMVIANGALDTAGAAVGRNGRHDPGRLEPAPDAPLSDALGLARQRYDHDRFEEAIRMLNGLLGDQPENPDALVLAAHCYERLGDVPRARDACSRVKKVNPRRSEAIELLARLPERGLTLEHLEGCPVCGAAGSTKVFELPDGALPLRLHQCHGCNLVFLNPRLTEASIKEVEEANTYYAYPPELMHEEVRKRIGLVKSFERHKRPPGRLIDIGCNRGLLMEAARIAGWEPFGIDISSAAVEQIQRDFGLEAFCGQLEDLSPRHPFDLCVAWHVLEHTTSPRDFIANLHRLLAPGGVLAIQVPCYSRLKEFSAGNRIASLVNKVHNFHFTRDTLGALLTDAELQILDLIEGQDLMLTAFARKP